MAPSLSMVVQIWSPLGSLHHPGLSYRYDPDAPCFVPGSTPGRYNLQIKITSPSPTTLNRRSGWLRMPEREKADCDTALWLMLSCGLDTCSCALCFDEKPARTMPFCLFPGSMGSQTEGGVPKQMMPSLLCFLFYDAFLGPCMFLSACEYAP